MHPHKLRHTFVTTMLDAGIDLRDVQIAARHSVAVPARTSVTEDVSGRCWKPRRRMATAPPRSARQARRPSGILTPNGRHRAG
jgi:integrase